MSRNQPTAYAYLNTETEPPLYQKLLVILVATLGFFMCASLLVLQIVFMVEALDSPDLCPKPVCLGIAMVSIVFICAMAVICMIPFTSWSIDNENNGKEMTTITYALIATWFLLTYSCILLCIFTWTSGMLIYIPQRNMDYIPVILSSLVFLLISSCICVYVLRTLLDCVRISIKATMTATSEFLKRKPSKRAQYYEYAV